MPFSFPFFQLGLSVPYSFFRLCLDEYFDDLKLDFKD